MASEDTESPRRAFVLRHGGVITWSLWAAGAALITTIAAGWAPLDTARDWLTLAAWLSAAFLVPALVAVAHHRYRLAGHAAWWSGWPLAVLVWVLLLAFGFQSVEWSAGAGGNFEGWRHRLAGALFLALVPGMTAGLLAAHLDDVRRTGAARRG